VGVQKRPRRRRLAKWLSLAGLAVLGVCTVSIPLTVAITLSATGASDVLSLDGITPKQHHQTPALAVSNARCLASRGYYALTFDDGPFPATTRELVNTLAKAKAVATFFDVGERAAAQEDLVELQRSVGQVANETYSQPRLTQVSQQRRFQELQLAARALDYPNVLFRAPFGDTSPAVEADVRRSGLTAVYWTVDGEDARLATSEIVTRAMTVQPAGIIRLHDGLPGTIAAVPAIVAGLRERGLCPGFIAATSHAVAGPNGVSFNAQAVKP
jgi:peptidoglycan/xylan/chitin deacetylase (PgdA/CDA1 family)